MSCTPPAALSIYRGQSRSGIGEGPGRPVSHGEQYLAAAPELLASAQLLDAIRPWMTLGSDPADHERLSDGLEGWSVLRLHGFDLVARLISAGRYERRAAFFAHGRLWPSEPGCPGFDPGLHMGRSEMFERAFRDDDTGERVPEIAPTLVRPDQIAAEPAVAALLLAHLLEGCARGRPLIVAAPLADFTAGAPLHALVAFARGALPADLKVTCRVRIYTRKPELFLGPLAANLVVLPEDSAERALTNRADATVLGRQGNRLAGDAPDAQALAYAKAVVERAIHIPGGLALFSERYRDRISHRGLPVVADVRALPITYNLAVALEGPAETSGDLLRSYLPDAAARLGTQVDWRRLLTPEDWRRLPEEAVEDLLLLDPQQLAPGARALQEAAEQVVGQVTLPIDFRLLSWWDPNAPSKRRRLLALAAARSEVWELLQRAVEERRFTADWASAYLKDASVPKLIEAAERLLAAPGFLRAGGLWQDVPRQLLDALRGLAAPPRQLAPLVRKAGETLAPEDDLGLYLRLTELAAAVGGEGPLVARLLDSLAVLDEPESLALLVERALDRRWPWLQPGALVDDGELRPPGLMAQADRLAGEDAILAALHPGALLRLGAHLTSDRNRARFLRELDQRMARDPEATTDALVRAGWWLIWRRGSGLEPGQLDRAAREWLVASAWSDDEVVPPREDWNAVLRDLPPQLSGAEMKRLRAEAGVQRLPWPWIAPFEEDQLAALVLKAADFGFLAELAEALADDKRFQEVGLPSAGYVLGRSGFAGRVPHDALGWLQAKPPQTPLPLRLQESSELWRAAGHREEEALAARMSSVAAALAAGDVTAALAAAEEPYLWHQPRFLTEIAGWICSRGSLQGLDGNLLAWIDQHIDGVPARYPERPSPGLIHELVHRKPPLAHIARLFSPRLLDEATRTALLAAACRALSEGLAEDDCWPALATEVARDLAARSAESSLLSALADQIRLRRAAGRQAFRDHGWRTFMAAVHRHPGLLSYCALQGAAMPVLDLAAALAGPGAIGQAALKVLLLRGGEVQGPRRDAWPALVVEGLRNRLRGQNHTQPDERDDVAVAILLSAAEDLEKDDRQVLWRALQDERLVSADWYSPADFGGERKMTGPVTFFRPRGDDVGETYDLVLDAEEETRQLYLATRRPLDPTEVRSRKLAIGDVAAAMKRVFGEIAGQGEGGAAVTLIDRQGRRSAAVQAASTVEDHAFRTFILLAPGSPPSVLPADSKWFDLPQGAHLLVPVDRRAEEHLVRFQEDLDWLPPDLAALVLYALRRPSLDTFVRRLDSHAAEHAELAGDTADDSGSFWKRFRRSTFLWPLLAAFLLIQLGANLLLLGSLRSRIDALSPARSKEAAVVATVERKNAGDGSHSDHQPSRSPAGSTPSGEIAGVLQTLGVSRKSLAAFEALDAGPFNGLAGGGEKEIARLLTGGRGLRPLVLGLMKLEALRLSIAPNSGLFFRAADNLTEIKAVYLSAGLGPLAADRDGRDLLAALACLAYPREGTPSLPKTTTTAFNFAPGSTCADFPLDKAVPGLTALRAFVQKTGQAVDAAGGASR